jgi:hypothetical protein
MMKKRSVVLALIVVMVALGSSSFAANEYVVVNENALVFNQLAVYQLDTGTGALTAVATLATGGKGLGNELGEWVFNTLETVSQNGGCVFAMDTFSSDIAAFSKATDYSLIGDYSNALLNANENGGSIALTPNGKFLYSTYSTTQNIGAWAVNSDCSLTFISAYVTSNGVVDGPLKVTPNGKELLVVNGGVETFTIDPNLGSLTDVGFLSFTSALNCQLEGCVPFSLDITKDSRVAVFGSNYVVKSGVLAPVALAAQITSTGLVKPRIWTLQNPVGVNGAYFPFLSAAAYSGVGNLYFGMANGVVTADFTEKPPKVSLANATLTSPGGFEAAIAVTGNTLVMAQWPDQIVVFSINPDGSLTQLSTTTIDNPKAFVYSLSVFPNTR